jgi:DNA polymerase V
MPSDKKRVPGRPKGQGPYGEATKPVRLPISMLEKVTRFVANRCYTLPLYSCKVQAGFPSLADDNIEDHVDFNEYLIQNPSATFLVKATGDSMINIGIFENSLLVVDTLIKPSSGKIAIVVLDGELTVKRLKYINSKLYLIAENSKYPPIEVISEGNLHILGVVTHVIQKVL